MIYFLNYYLYDLNHTLYNVQSCGQSLYGGEVPQSLLISLSGVRLPVRSPGGPGYGQCRVKVTGAPLPVTGQ